MDDCQGIDLLHQTLNMSRLDSFIMIAKDQETADALIQLKGSWFIYTQIFKCLISFLCYICFFLLCF